MKTIIITLSENELAILEHMGYAYNNFDYFPLPVNDKKLPTMDNLINFNKEVDELRNKIGFNHKYTFNNNSCKE